MMVSELQYDKVRGVEGITFAHCASWKRKKLLRLLSMLTAVVVTVQVWTVSVSAYLCRDGQYCSTADGMNQRTPLIKVIPVPSHQRHIEPTWWWLSDVEVVVPQRQGKFSHRLMASTTEDGGSTSSPPPTPPDDDTMLMYVLGVNLARQLGDIRPLLISPTDDDEEEEDAEEMMEKEDAASETGNNAATKRQRQYAKELSQVTAGIVDTLIGRVNEAQQILLLQQHGKALNALIQQRALKLQQKLVRAGQEMLNIMAETDGAITIPESNVVVHILNRTDDTNIPNYGMRPTKSSIVKMHYHGTLADGTIFESSYVATKSSDSDSNSNKNTIEPVNVPIAKLVPGLRDGMVQHMTVGDTAMIGVPPVVGYGIITTPPNPNVPDNSTLFYKVQLVDVLTAGIGGSEQNVPTLLNADGTKLSSSTSSTLLGANGRPLI